MPRRVLFLAWAPFFSGAERALLLTLRSLDTSRYEPVVISGTDGDFAANVRALGIPCKVLPITQLDFHRPWASTLAVARVVAAAARYSPSIIHSNDMPSYQPGGYAARMLRIPAVSHLRFPAGAEGYHWFFRPRPSLAIFISEWFKKSAVAEAPDLFGNGRAIVVYDAVEPPALWSPHERLIRRQQLGLPIDSPVVAITGQIAEVKGIWDFVESANLLCGTNATFAVLGDDLQTNGALRREMEARVDGLGLRNRFRFLGFRPDAPVVVQAFDIVVVPSRVEPFGLASLEAMAGGRPVVASRVGGIPEVVVDGRTGILVPSQDPEALAAAVRNLLEDPARGDEMGREGRRRAESVFALKQHGRALQDVYDQLILNGSRHPQTSLPLGD